MTKMWDLDDLVTVQEISERTGVVKNTVSMWRVRYHNFPQPRVSFRRNIRLWSWNEVETWWSDRVAQRQANWKDDDPL